LHFKVAKLRHAYIQVYIDHLAIFNHHSLSAYDFPQSSLSIIAVYLLMISLKAVLMTLSTLQTTHQKQSNKVTGKEGRGVNGKIPLDGYWPRKNGNWP
jgi:hypothetical protein